METKVREEDEVYEAYVIATGDARNALQSRLIQLLTAHANAICWLQLHTHRPDICNEAVFRALQHEKGFKGESKFSTWFQRVVLNLIASDMRRAARRKEDSLVEIHSTTDTGPLEARIDSVRLLKLLNKAEREIFQYKLLELDEATIGAKIGLSPEGVRTRWHRIRKKLLKLLR